MIFYLAPKNNSYTYCQSAFGMQRGRFRITERKRLTFFRVLMSGMLLWALAFCKDVAALDKIYYAGQSFTSNSSSIASNFKFTVNSLDTVNTENLNRYVLQGLEKNHKYHYTSDALGDSKNAGNATALALSLDSELVSVVKIGSLYKLLYELSAQALYFDFYEKQVLAGYPFTLSYVEVFDQQPTHEDIQRTVNKFLFEGGQNPLGREFVSVVSKADVPNPSSKRIRVRNVDIEPAAQAWLPDVEQVENIKNRYGHEFGKYLGTNQSISVLPASAGTTIGNAMAARFANGDVYQLKIPEEDYQIDIVIKGFKKLQASKTNIASVYVYGAFTEIVFKEPLSGKEFFRSPVKLGATKTIPVTQTSTDDWASANEALIQLFDEFTKQINSGNKAWQLSHMGSDQSGAMNDLFKLLEKCK